MMGPDDFYEWHEQPRQGDIVLCGVSRIIAEDHRSPSQWESLDAHFVQINDAWDNGKPLGIAAASDLRWSSHTIASSTRNGTSEFANSRETG